LAEIFLSYYLIQEHSRGSPLLNSKDVKHLDAELWLKAAAVKLYISQTVKCSNTGSEVFYECPSE